MKDIMQIVIENVRTFDQRHEIPLAPLTILTGENSTGKSSLLGMISALSSESFPLDPPFDSSPYSLGGYDTIATYKGGRYGRAKHFSIGFTTVADGHSVKSFARYESDGGRAELAEYEVRAASQCVRITVDDRDSTTRYASLKFQNGRDVEIPLQLPRRNQEEVREGFSNTLLTSVFRPANRQRVVSSDVVDALLNLIYHARFPATSSLAPIRTRPSRIYSQTKQAYAPGGDHIPFVLDRIFNDPSSRSERSVLSQALHRFGHESGLFDDVSIKKMGNKLTAPFQLMVKLGKRPRNLIDVGYGVSQALPVVVQSVLENPARIVLMQQPEVHLHPKAQAALGSFLSRLTADTQRRFVIETHSDFIVDRIRQEVNRKALDCNDVLILFFRRSGYETEVHPLRLDTKGNIVNPPRFYRAFFLREEMNVIGLEDT